MTEAAPPAVPVRNQESMTKVVLGLLAKAERTDFDDEARAASKKAMELAKTHSITEAMIDAFRFAGERAKPVRVRFKYSANKSFMKVRLDLLNTIAVANDCQVVYRSGDTFADIFGFEDDVNFVQVLYLSTLTQMVREGDRALYSYEAGVKLDNRYSWRRQYYIGYVESIGMQLWETRQRVVAEAERQNPGKAELVLRDRAAEVKDLVDATYNRLRRSGSRDTITNYAAYTRGNADGAKADVTGGRPTRGAAGYVGKETKAVEGR